MHLSKRKRPLRLVIDSHIIVLPCAAGASGNAGEEWCQSLAGNQTVRIASWRFRSRRCPTMQALAADERAKPQRPPQRQLLFNWPHLDVQAQAVDDDGLPLAWRAGPAPPLFLAQACTCTSQVKSRRNTPSCCARLTPSPLKNCAPLSPPQCQKLLRPHQPGPHHLPAAPIRRRHRRRPHCGYVAALRAVLASDFMTADGAELPYALLKNRAAHHPRSARPSGA